MTSPIGPGGPIGGVGTTSGADVLIVPVPPDTSTNIQDGYNHLSRNVGELRIVSSAADYEFHYPNIGGVHTVTAGTIQTATVVLPNGFRVHIAAGGYIKGQFGVTTALVGSVAAPLVSGDPLVLETIAIANSDPGGTNIDGTSTSGLTTILRNVVITSPIAPTPICPAGSIHDLTPFGNVAIEGINIDSVTAGLTLDGFIAAARISTSTISNMPAGAIGYTLGPTANVTVAIGWSFAVFLTSFADQRIIRIDPAATIPNTPVVVPTSTAGVRLSNNSVADAGALGAVLDETGITDSDIRVFATGSLYGTSSQFIGAYSFLANVTPITKTYSNPNVFEPIPRSNGGVGPGDAIAVVQSDRFDLQTPGADPPGEWYGRYLGPLPIQTSVQYTMSIEAVSTSSIVKTRAEFRNGAMGAWTPIEESTAVQIQVNNAPRSINGSGVLKGVTDDTQFRVTIANDNAAASSEILAVSLLITGTI